MKLSTVAVNDVHVSFGDEMKQARQRLGMTQAELAEAVGASLSAAGHSKVSMTTDNYLARGVVDPAVVAAIEQINPDRKRA